MLAISAFHLIMSTALNIVIQLIKPNDLTPRDDRSNIRFMSHTKEKIIEAGTIVLLRKGFNGAGLKEILDAANVPKGSFYHFFKNKEAFGKEALIHYSNEFKPVLQQFLIDSKQPPIQRIPIFFQTMADIFEQEKECKGGCLVGNIAQELADINPSLRSCILQIMASWNDYLTHCLDEAQKAGELSPNTDTKALAEFILNSWEGALLKMKIVSSPKPLQNFIRQITKILKCYQ